MYGQNKNLVRRRDFNVAPCRLFDVEVHPVVGVSSDCGGNVNAEQIPGIPLERGSSVGTSVPLTKYGIKPGHSRWWLIINSTGS